MKLGQILLLGLTLAFLIIGVDQSLKLGFSNAYWAFMIALGAFFAFTLKKTRDAGRGDQDQSAKKASSSRKGKGTEKKAGF